MAKKINYLKQKIRIPDDWIMKKLDDVIRLHGGYVFSSKDYSDEGIPIIRISNISVGGSFIYKHAQSKKCPYDLFSKLKPFRLKKGDLIIALTDVSTRKPIIGRTAIIDVDKDFLMNQRVGRIDIKDNINKRFLHYYFNSPLFRWYVRKQSKKSAQANLTLDDLKKADIIYPSSIEEQKRVSDLIHSLEKKIKLLKKKLRLYRKFFDKVLFQSFEKVNKRSNIKIVRLADLCHIKRGTSPRPIKDPKWFGNKAGWIRIKDVTNAGKYLRKTKDYLSEAGMEKSVCVNRGEIILSISSTMGKPVIVDMLACIHDGLVVFKDLSEELDSEYLYYYLKKSEYDLLSKQQNNTQGNLNVPIISSFRLPLPSIEEQRGITSPLSLLDERISLIREKLASLDSLKRNISHRLMIGEIRLV
jgi:type I restriction enzyme S subunit